MPRKQFLGGILIIALLIRLGMVITFGETKSPPLYEQGEIARNMYHGHGFSFHAWYMYTSLLPERREIMRQPPQFETANQPPLYTFLFYYFFCLFGDTSAVLLTIMLFNCLIGAITPLIVYWIAQEFSSEEEARLSALFCMFFLPGAQTVAKFLGTTFFILIGLCAIYALIRAVREMTLKTTFLLGVSLGLWSLIRSEAMLLGLFLILAVAFSHLRQQGFRFIVLYSGITLLIMALFLTPWTYRNYYLFERLIPTVSRPWHEIWKGNNALFEGSLYGASGEEKNQLFAGDTLVNRRICIRLDSIPYNQAFEPTMDDVFKEEAMSYIQSHPVRTLQMTALKAAELWTFDFFYEKTRHFTYILSILPFTICAAIGLITLYQRRHIVGIYPIWLCLLLIYGYYTAIFGITFYMVRYQVYFVSLLLPLSGIGAWQLIQSRKKSASSTVDLSA